MIKYSTSIDFNKYHTFFLEYFKDCKSYDLHCVRPCTATYDDIDNHRAFSITLDGAVLTFDSDTTLSEIVLECALRGIQLDFIDIKVEKNPKDGRYSEHTIFQTIDTHKEDVTKYLEAIEAPKHYVAKNRHSKDVLKFLVIDRFIQDCKVDFFKGQYENKAVIAGFKDYDTALQYCAKLN